MEEIKAILESLVSNCLRASNADDEEKKDEKAENKKACNEEVDKRDIIRQIMAIAGKEEASEDVKTIAKLAEKLAYDKSEADTADNSKKAKNEDDEEKEDDKKAENKKAKNEEVDEEKEVIEEEKEAENKKACNSIAIDKAVNDILSATNQSAPKYETQMDRLEEGNKY